MTTIAAALATGAERLAGQENPRLEAELLLAHVLAKPRSHLFAWPDRTLDPETAAAFDALLARRERGEPVAHILGEREFWSLPLAVTPATLIPRPDTERLVEAALECLPRPTARILDLGTGSGAVALALAEECPRATITATDRSPAALAVARANAKWLGRLERVRLLAGDWFEPVAGERFDLLVSNPPYIPAGDAHLDRGDLRFEPQTALAAGPDGLDAIRVIAAGARAHLAPGGWLLLEHGFDQGKAVRALLVEAGLEAVETLADLAGRDRVTRGRSPDGDDCP